MIRIALAVVHLLGFGIGLGAIFARARAMSNVRDLAGLKRGLTADNWWGISAMLLLGSGLWRAFASTEKTSSYYWTNHVFYAKMGLFALILALEIWPMITLIRWRIAQGRGTLPAIESLHAPAKTIARLSDVQTLLLVCMVVAAVMMARGYGALRL